ncbi:26S proteasome non-ATPase regulatory subunit 8 [Gonapodya prolifera JEL478]|uniref:26S proteasome non-ATPase regulatory subunit 8 n=1 Tax=Gonapodya prolifera (strain JEL478) TaxID=1344416 RepID=A0A139ATH5_GONPJ|nr:26S proteasome non-ATPase regulatory subunit 8 [Gonapodya prolifera JEL478]|eukprot:KXS20037.1 26S proteasome non-ATPase regulatory subunit 8 [Gonapodya prolifera JEL478]
MSQSLQTTAALFEQLKKEFHSPKPDLKKCGQILGKLKVALTELSFLVGGDKQPDPKELLLAREVLEVGAQYSIRVQDIPQFERYISQLKTYYRDYSNRLPPSQRLYPLLGLNLLRLLAQNRLAEFHAELETLDTDVLNNNVYIRHSVQVEQCLMEGSYNKVWNSRESVPAEEYKVFMDILMDTIRNEIASCSEKAYISLPLADAATLLHFKRPEEVLSFAKERGWDVDPVTRTLHFSHGDVSQTDIPRDQVLTMMIGYAKELERIV